MRMRSVGVEEEFLLFDAEHELSRGFATVEFDARAVAAMLGLPEPVAEDSLERLVDASLLLQPAPGRYRLHDLVAVYARRLGADEPAARAGVRSGTDPCR